MLFQEQGKCVFKGYSDCSGKGQVTANSMQGTFKTALAGGGNLNPRRLQDKRNQKQILGAGFHLVHL